MLRSAASRYIDGTKRIALCAADSTHSARTVVDCIEQAAMNLRERGMGSRLQRVQAAVLEQLDGLFLAESFLLTRELGGVRLSQFVLQYHDARPLPGIDTTRRHMKPRAVPYNKFRVGPGRTGWATPCGGTRGSRADSVRRLL